MTPERRPDPFAEARDAGEVRAAAVMQEYWIRASPPAQVYRQGDSPLAYALVVPHLSGARVLTVPGAHEADFLFHGSSGTNADALATFIAGAVSESGADHLRLPLLSEAQASVLQSALAAQLPTWRLGSGLSSVSPVAHKSQAQSPIPRSLRVAFKLAVRAGLAIDQPSVFPLDEIRTLHVARWGNNRDDGFFGMLACLVEHRCAELITARSADGRLVAAQLDIIGSAIRHDYYATSDTEHAPGAGTAVLAFSWMRFADSDQQRVYSFGRGSERYKYVYADASRDLFELRGFFAPTRERK